MDNEVSGTGNQYDYGFRIYNPRVGRFLSVDPLTASYPMLTPYQYASNNPIMFIDIDGLEGGIPPQIYEFGYYIEMKVTDATDAIGRAADATGEAMKTLGRGTYKLLENYANGVADRVMYGGSGNMPFENITHFTTAPRDVKETVENTVESVKQFPYMSPEDKVATVEGWAITAASLYYGGKSIVKGFKASALPAPMEGITLKDRTPQVGTSFKNLSASISEGRINIAGRAKTYGKFDFVITNDGKLKIGTGHYYLSEGAESVQAAGRLTIYEGKVKQITNWSGHYEPSILEGQGFGDLLKEGGIDVSGAELKLYNAEGELKSKTVLK